MAKGNLFNGLAHGSVGDVVFTRQNGEQISKMRNRRPRNPRSPGQLIQRAIMSTVWLAYKAGKDIFDHSFEHRSVGGATMNEFVSMNTKILRALVAEEKNIIPTSRDTVADVRARLVAPGSVYPVAFDGMIVSSGTYQQSFFQVIPAHMDGDEEDYLSFLVPAELNDSETCREYAERLGLISGDLYTLLGFYQPRELPQYLDGYDDGFSHMGMQIQESFFAIRLRVRDDFVNDGSNVAKGSVLSDLFTVDYVRGPQINADIILGMGIGVAFNMFDVLTVSQTQELSWANIIRSHVDSKLRSKTVLLRSSMFQDCGVIPAYLVDAWSRVYDKVVDSSLILEGGFGTKSAGGIQPTPTPFVPTLFNRMYQGNGLLVDNAGKVVVMNSLIFRSNGVGSYECTDPSGYPMPDWGAKGYTILEGGIVDVNGSIYQLTYESMYPGATVTINPAPGNYSE